MTQPADPPSSFVKGIVAAVIVALLAGSSAPWWWDSISPPDSPSAQTPAAGSIQTPAAQSPSESEPDLATIPPTSPEPSTGCQIVISNPLVTLYEEKDSFGLEVGRVPTGTYTVQEIDTVPFGGQVQRWYRIVANGDSGWIQDSTILISSKTGNCT